MPCMHTITTLRIKRNKAVSAALLGICPSFPIGYGRHFDRYTHFAFFPPPWITVKETEPTSQLVFRRAKGYRAYCPTAAVPINQSERFRTAETGKPRQLEIDIQAAVGCEVKNEVRGTCTSHIRAHS